MTAAAQEARNMETTMAAKLRCRQSKVPKRTYLCNEPRPRISEDTRIKILFDWQAHKDIRATARKHGVDPKSVRYTIRRFRKHRTVHDLPKSGSPHKITAQAMSELKRFVCSHTDVKVQDCIKWLELHHHVTVCARTMLFALKAHGMWDYIPQRKPLMSTEHAALRFAWAREKVQLPDDEWKRVVFSDEKEFSQTAGGKKEKVILIKGTPFGPARMIPSLPFGGAKVNVWAAISSNGFLAYELYDGALSGAAYVKILKRKLLPAALVRFGSHEDWEFEQDNASWHTVDEVYNLLEPRALTTLIIRPSAQTSVSLKTFGHAW